MIKARAKALAFSALVAHCRGRVYKSRTVHWRKFLRKCGPRGGRSRVIPVYQGGNQTRDLRRPERGPERIKKPPSLSTERFFAVYGHPERGGPRRSRTGHAKQMYHNPRELSSAPDKKARGGSRPGRNGPCISALTRCGQWESGEPDTEAAPTQRGGPKGRGREPPGRRPRAPREPPSGGRQGRGGGPGEKPAATAAAARQRRADGAAPQARGGAGAQQKAPGPKAETSGPKGPRRPRGQEPTAPEAAQAGGPGGTRRGHAKRSGEPGAKQGRPKPKRGSPQRREGEPKRSGTSERPRRRASAAQVPERESRGEGPRGGPGKRSAGAMRRTGAARAGAPGGRATERHAPPAASRRAEDGADCAAPPQCATRRRYNASARATRISGAPGALPYAARQGEHGGGN